MDEREILKALNSINYTEEELENLENEVIQENNRASVELYKIKNDDILRKVVLLELEKKVKAKLSKDEEIKYKIIVLQSYLEKDVHFKLAADFGTAPIIYLGLFITNNRVFIFKLSHYYKLMEGDYINNIENLKSIIDLWEQCNTIGLKFNKCDEFMLRPIGKYNTKMFLEIIRYLRSVSNSSFEDYKKPKLGIFGWLIIIILFMIAVSITYSGIKDALSKIP